MPNYNPDFNDHTAIPNSAPLPPYNPFSVPNIYANTGYTQPVHALWNRHTDPLTSSVVEKTDIKSKKKSNSKSKETADRSEKLIEQLRMEIEQLAEENARLQGNLDDQDLEIRAAQDVQAKMIDSKGFAQTEDDGKVRAALLTIAGSWKIWAKAHASLKPGLKDADFKIFVDQLGIAQPFLGLNEACKAPSTLLNAALANFIRCWIFENPFHFMPTDSKIEGFAHPNIRNEQKAFQMAYERASYEGELSSICTPCNNL